MLIRTRAERADRSRRAPPIGAASSRHHLPTVHTADRTDESHSNHTRTLTPKDAHYGLSASSSFQPAIFSKLPLLAKPFTSLQSSFTTSTPHMLAISASAFCM